MNDSIWTKAFWQATLERAITTAAQAGLLVIGASQLDVLDLNWVNFAGFVGGGFVLAVLKGLAANAITKTGPGLTNDEITVDSPSAPAAVAEAKAPA